MSKAEVMFPVQTQMGFHFTADNCIGCHSCEAACSEKNNLPSHIAWRKVGYVEGGSYPQFTRVNTSMACNHCTDPVCLKGCPTGAYVKYEKYGAVIQDSDICFGCQYCTWVCPYNAPAYNPETGSVSKCNMCVDRLDVGLKPACVSACLGHALEFGEVAKMENERGQALLQISGFPDPSLSQPNIRFKQIKETPDIQYRTDVEPVNYSNKHSQGGGIKPLALKPLTWNSLASNETPLVFFTLLSQMVVGGFLAFIGYSFFGSPLSPLAPERAMLLTLAGCLFTALALSTGHLGKPQYCYRALNNLRYSWVSREILTVGSFFGGLAAYIFFQTFHLLPSGLLTLLGGGTAIMGILSLVAMSNCYLIPARPYWNHPHTVVSFFGTMTILGLLMTSLFLAYPLIGGVFSGRQISFYTGLKQGLLGLVSLYLLIRYFSRILFFRYLKGHSGESQASFQHLQEAYPGFLKLDWVLQGFLFLNLVVMLFLPVSGALFGSILISFLTAAAWQIVDRAIFYNVVIPTTMPGAFFLKNKGFENFARETGLAKDRVVGVLDQCH
ncbi:MAG: dimethyl sulfoxide reductase anchor subunit [Nitrospirae bacterium]|nr:dimethyl sulfoxide reductase anchor subunit [Nitrospirota bacterium]